MSYEETCQELKECYDGYHFTFDSAGIYNPFSLLNTFDSMSFGNYWFETGTPSYLVKLLKRDNYDLHQLANDKATSDTLNSIDFFFQESCARDLSEWLSYHQRL